jgi:CBS domain-containing protein
MENNKIQLLPVVKNNKVIGVIHIHNLIEAGIK